MRFVLVRSILNHIIAVFLQDTLVLLAYGIHIICSQKSVDRSRESAYSNIEVQVISHRHMNPFRNWRFLRIELPEHLDDIRIHSVRPKKFFEVQWIHFNDILAANRNGVDAKIFRLC